MNFVNVIWTKDYNTSKLDDRSKGSSKPKLRWINQSWSEFRFLKYHLYGHTHFAHFFQQTKSVNTEIAKDDDKHELDSVKRDYPKALPGSEYKMELSWKNIILFILMHSAAAYGLFAAKNSWATIIVSELNTFFY